MFGDESLTAAAREAIMARPRPRSALPILPDRPPSPGLDREAHGAGLTPTYAVWELTLKCDLACRHCGSRAGPARPAELSTSECLSLVEQLAALGVREVTLIGGEAYLRDDWLEIVEAITRHGMSATMTTGGRGLTRERARDAKQAGLRAVSVSVDGLEATHDRLRGLRGAYQSALEAFSAARTAKLPHSANSQLNRLVMPELLELTEVLIAERINSWQLAITAPMGRAADEPDVLLQPYDLLELFPRLARAKARCDEAGVSFWPANNVGYFGPFEHELRAQHPGRHMSSCSAGRGSIGIEADGTIKGCPSMPSSAYGAGNVREHSLETLWRHGKALAYTRTRTVEDLWGYCRGCYYAEACMAGCTWTSHVIFGRPGNNPYCHHRALEMQREGRRERLVPTQAAPGEPFDHGRFELVVEPVPRGA